MRRIWILGWLLAAALAQGLVLPETAQAGRPVEISAEGLEPGAYPIEIGGPAGSEVVTLVTTENGGRIRWTPTEPGRYRLTLYAPGAKYSAELEVAPPPPRVALEPEGLRIGEHLLPLPPGDWTEPVEGARGAYLGLRGAPLVLWVGYETPLKPAAYYPPGRVKEVHPLQLDGEAVAEVAVELADGSRPSLALGGLGVESGPYAGPMEALEPLRRLDAFWREHGVLDRLPADPVGYRPYWAFWGLDPARLTADDLEAWGRDLLRRGHRVELAWGEEARAWTDLWQQQALAGRTQGLEPARALTLALLDYAPIHPGARAFFLQQADWLQAQGRLADALRLREAVNQARAFAPVLEAAGLRRAFYVLVLAYLALVVVLFARYLPAQRRDLAAWGGLLGSWSANPLRRMTRLLLAYAGWGERLLAVLLFAALLAAGLLWGAVTGFEAEQSRGPFARATLADAIFYLEPPAAGSGNEKVWPKSPARDALAAYAFAVEERLGGRTDEVEARLNRAPGWLAFADALRYHRSGDEKALEQAYRSEARYTPVLERLGLAADAWTDVYRRVGVDRLGVPRTRDLCRVYLAGVLAQLPQQPTAPLEALGVPNAWAWAVLALLGLWGLLHLWVLLLPRPRGTVRAAGPLVRAVELLVPGSTSLGKGWGVVLLLVAAYGVMRLLAGEAVAGSAMLIAAYLPHLVLWYGEVHR